MAITTVYVPLDGSERAARAIAPAAALAERCEAEVVLLAARWPDESLDTVERYLEVQAAFVDHPKTRTLVMQDRAPALAICTAAGEAGAMVCMSTRGRGAARGALLGSVGEEVLRTASRPLLLVGLAFEPTWTLPRHPVVIAGIDGSDLSLGALRDASDLAGALDGRVRIVEVVRPEDEPLRRRRDWDVTARLDHLIAESRERGIRVDSVLVDGFDPATALSVEARDRAAACIAIASHGRTGLGRVVLGSVAVATVRHARCPVLVSGPRVHRHASDRHH